MTHPNTSKNQVLWDPKNQGTSNYRDIIQEFWSGSVPKKNGAFRKTLTSEIPYIAERFLIINTTRPIRVC